MDMCHIWQMTTPDMADDNTLHSKVIHTSFTIAHRGGCMFVKLNIYYLSGDMHVSQVRR